MEEICQQVCESTSVIEDLQQDDTLRSLCELDSLSISSTNHIEQLECDDCTTEIDLQNNDGSDQTTSQTQANTPASTAEVSVSREMLFGNNTTSESASIHDFTASNDPIRVCMLFTLLNKSSITQMLCHKSIVDQIVDAQLLFVFKYDGFEVHRLNSTIQYPSHDTSLYEMPQCSIVIAEGQAICSRIYALHDEMKCCYYVERFPFWFFSRLFFCTNSLDQLSRYPITGEYQYYAHLFNALLSKNRRFDVHQITTPKSLYLALSKLYV